MRYFFIVYLLLLSYQLVAQDKIQTKQLITSWKLCENSNTPDSVSVFDRGGYLLIPITFFKTSLITCDQKIGYYEFNKNGTISYKYQSLVGSAKMVDKVTTAFPKWSFDEQKQELRIYPSENITTHFKIIKFTKEEMTLKQTDPLIID